MKKPDIELLYAKFLRGDTFSDKEIEILYSALDPVRKTLAVLGKEFLFPYLEIDRVCTRLEEWKYARENPL